MDIARAAEALPLSAENEARALRIIAQCCVEAIGAIEAYAGEEGEEEGGEEEGEAEKKIGGIEAYQKEGEEAEGEAEDAIGAIEAYKGEGEEKEEEGEKNIRAIGAYTGEGEGGEEEEEAGAFGGRKRPLQGGAGQKEAVVTEAAMEAVTAAMEAEAVAMEATVAAVGEAEATAATAWGVGEVEAARQAKALAVALAVAQGSQAAPVSERRRVGLAFSAMVLRGYLLLLEATKARGLVVLEV